MKFEPNESFYAVAICEAGDEAIAVLPDALHEVIGHSDVKCAVPLARKYINEESHVCWPWTPAFAGVSGYLR